MGKGKLEKFKEVAEFENTWEYTDFQGNGEEKPKGSWGPKIFKNDNPIVFELACGKGAYTLELARKFPEKNFIGIDIKGARIWKGAKKALEEGLENVRFLRIYIDHLEEYFAAGEVDDIWITFPDPYPKKSDRSKRLTSPKFLDIYSKVLAAEGTVKLKTDSDHLFSYTKDVVEQTACEALDVVHNIYESRSNDEMLSIQTDYERRHLAEGRTISYIEFSLPEN